MKKRLDRPVDWRLHDLPAHDYGSWSVLKNGRAKNYTSSGEALDTLAKWSPGQNIFCASPSDERYRVPIQISEFYLPLKTFAQRQAIIAVILFSTATAIMLFFTAIHPNKATIGFVLVMLIATLIRGYDAFIAMKSAAAVTDRSLFFHWVRTDKRIYRCFIATAAFISIIGIVQLLLQWRMPLDEIIFRYGASYQKLRTFEVWRLISGPLFHGSLLHFANNTIFFISIAPLALFYFRFWAVASFFVANSLGAEMQMLSGSDKFDAYLGISPGIFCLAALVSSSNILGKSFLPRGLPALVNAMILISLISAASIINNSANVAHITGIVVGICFSAAWVATNKPVNK